MALEKHLHLKINKDPENQAYQAPQGSSGEPPELDVIEKLRSNIRRLSMLQKKMAFMNAEIQSVVGMDSDKY